MIKGYQSQILKIYEKIREEEEVSRERDVKKLKEIIPKSSRLKER